MKATGTWIIENDKHTLRRLEGATYEAAANQAQHLANNRRETVYLVEKGDLRDYSSGVFEPTAE